MADIRPISTAVGLADIRPISSAIGLAHIHADSHSNTFHSCGTVPDHGSPNLPSPIRILHGFSQRGCNRSVVYRTAIVGDRKSHFGIHRLERTSQLDNWLPMVPLSYRCVLQLPCAGTPLRVPASMATATADRSCPFLLMFIASVTASFVVPVQHQIPFGACGYIQRTTESPVRVLLR